MSNDNQTMTEQEVESKLSELLSRAQATNNEISETNASAEAALSEAETKINKSVEDIEAMFVDLDKLDEEANNEFDKLNLDVAEDLASE